MISHSPPIFSHSPPVSFLSDYMSGNHRQAINYNDEANRSSRGCRPQVITLASKAMVNNASNMAALQQQQQHQPQRLNNNSVGALNANYTNSNNNNSTNMGNNSTINTNTNTNISGNNTSTANRGNRASLGRVGSMPLLNTQPKSCLSRKSCLHKCNNRSADGCANNCEQSRARKKVIFADDEGLSLTEVRVMSEPSNVPPYWSVKFLEQITQGLVSPHPPDQWTVDFKQPASDYLTFRQKIEREYVSLENVIVKDEESIVVGTIKVKNTSFEKEVIVRVTWDDWKSQQDIFCTFARTYGLTTCAHVVFDTFSFKITLPPSSKRLEFCICYRCKDQEYWDNNDGKNYTISKRSPFYFNALSPYEKGRNSCQNHMRSTLSEALAKTHDQQPSWAEDQHTPYW